MLYLYREMGKKKIEKIGKIVGIGNSKGLIIDRVSLEYLGVDKGDMVKFIVENVEDKDNDKE